MEMLREIDGTLAMLENKLNVIGDNNQIILESQNGSRRNMPRGRMCNQQHIECKKRIRRVSKFQETISAFQKPKLGSIHFGGLERKLLKTREEKRPLEFWEPY